MVGHRGTRRRPAPGAGRPAHRLGQVRRLLRRDPPAAGRGRRPDRDREPAARADAQPDRRRRAGRHPGGHHQLDQHRAVGADPRPDPCRRDRRPAGQPRAAQQPRLPRRGAAPAGGDVRSARGRRGALHLRLGTRLPARLPPDPHPARRPARRHPRPGDHGHRQRPRDRRRGGPARHRRPGPARQPRPRVAPARGGPAQDRAAEAGLAGRPPRRAARVGHRLLPHRRRHPGDRRLPPVPRLRRRGLLRPDRDDRAAGPRAGPDRRPRQGAGRHERLGHGLRRDPRLRGQHGGAAVAGRLLPAGRPRRPRDRPGHRRAPPRAGGPRHLGLFRVPRVPARVARPRDPPGAGRGAGPGRPRGDRGPGRAQPDPPRADAEGARRRRRRPPRPGRLGRDRASRGPTTRTATCG